MSAREHSSDRPGRAPSGARPRPADADRAGAPERVGDLLPTFLEGMGLAEGVARQEALVRWEAVVGERIARVSRALAVSGEVLFVEVDSSAWMSELALMKHEILKRLNAGRKEGRVERIVLTLSGGSPNMENPPRNR